MRMIACLMLLAAAVSGADSRSERFADREAELSWVGDSSEFKIGEPIRMKLRIKLGAPYWFFTPEFIRVQDENGHEVNLFTRPVSGSSGGRHGMYMRRFAERVIDLTSFVVLQPGVEYVNEFAPGRYTATFYFDSDTMADWTDFPYGYVLPRVFEGRTSNTLEFTVLPKREKWPSYAELHARAWRKIEKGQGEEAVQLLKRAILQTRDLDEIRLAITEIRALRGHVQWDDGPLLSLKQLAREEPKPFSRERIPAEELAVEVLLSLHWYLEYPHDMFLLALQHVDPAEREKWVKHWYSAQDYRSLETVEQALPSHHRLLASVLMREFFNVLSFPQFVRIVEAHIRADIASVPRHALEAYYNAKSDRDPTVLELVRKKLGEPK